MPITHVGDLTGSLASILRKQELELLTRTKDILEEILESVEIASDKTALKSLREGLRDMKAGRTRPYKDLAKELRRSHEL
jgi:hypothetical protein